MQANKKTIGIITGLIILSLIITGCTKNKEPVETDIDNEVYIDIDIDKDSSIEEIKDKDYLNENTEEDDLFMEDEYIDESLIEKEEFNVNSVINTFVNKDIYTTDDKLQFTIENIGEDYILEFGRPYKLEKSDGIALTEIQLDLMFTMELIIVGHGESFTQEVNLKDLESGTYRISKDIYVKDPKVVDETPTLITLEKDFHIE